MVMDIRDTARGGILTPRLIVGLAIALFGLVMAPIFVAGTVGAILTLAIGLGLMGLTYGPLGTVLSELFPTSIRASGFPSCSTVT